jgi:PIN domain nuclease of toxin-antitoxin system
MLNLDTNVLLAAFHGRLRRDEERVLGSDRWSISAIVLWEIAKLGQAGRIQTGIDDPEMRSFLRQIRVWPLSLDVAEAILRLDFSGDPADEIIAATSLVHGAPLLTRDTVMLRSAIVPLAVR